MRKIKKALPIALVIVTLFVFLTLGVSAADCDHVWDEQYHAPTCTEKGWSNGVCNKCGATTYEDGYYMEYAPTGHLWKEDWHDPTCTTGGWSNAKCKYCGVIDNSQYQDYSGGYPALGHSYQYQSNGAETHILECSRCGKTSGTEQSHSWSNRTLLYQGSDEAHYIFEYTCSVCEATKTQEESIGCGDNHNWSYNKVDSQYHRQECMTCATTGATSAHRWDNGVVDQAPTLNVEGYFIYTCLDCSAQKEEVTPALTINDILNRCTEKEAVKLFDALFVKFDKVLNNNSAAVSKVERLELADFVTVILPDIAENGKASKYFADYGSYYRALSEIEISDSLAYAQGYNDATGAVIDGNPITGLFQGMWSGLISFITVVGNGVTVGGISLMSVFSTAIVLLIALIVGKVVIKK